MAGLDTSRLPPIDNYAKSTFSLWTDSITGNKNPCHGGKSRCLYTHTFVRSCDNTIEYCQYRRW